MTSRLQTARRTRSDIAEADDSRLNLEQTVAASCRAGKRSRLDAGALGDMLRAARTARGLSQLELSLRLGVSQRHLGFVELGRSRPSRGMLLTILDALAPPRSVRNATLLAAGYAPDTPASAQAGSEFLAALKAMLAAHEPYPAILFDADWICHAVNRGAQRLCALLMPGSTAASAADGRFDMIEAVAHPNGLLSLARDPARVAASLLSQFWAEACARPSLHARIRACGEALERRYGPLPARPRDPGTPYLDLCFDTPLGPLRFSTFQAVPGLPQDVNTVSQRVELWYPNDECTRAALNGGERRPG